MIDYAISPTCTSEGRTAGKHCSACNEIFVEQSVIGALGHDLINYEAKPDCTETGWDAYIACSRCSYSTYVEKKASGHSFSNKVCTKCNSVGISSANELKNISGGGKYVLMNNINLNGTQWTPIEFYGTFDGNGYEISNFQITGNIQYSSSAITGYAQYCGLFASNSRYGVIKNLGVVNFTIDIIYIGEYSDKNYVAGLVAVNYGTIKNCYAIGNITSNTRVGHTPVGGLVGLNSGTIDNSYASVNVSVSYNDPSGSYTASQAGGLVADNTGTINNCYATGDVYSSLIYTDAGFAQCVSRAGGLVAYNEGTIKNCFATGNVSSRARGLETTGWAYAGGLVGGYDGGCITNCYRYTEQEIEMKGYYELDPIALGTAKSLSTLQSVSFYTSTLKWDSEIWNFTEGSYPTLK